MNIIPLKNKYGEVTHFAAIERDVSERKFHIDQLEKRNEELKALKQDLQKLVDSKSLELQKANAKLAQLAYLDHLTNIPNRRHFFEQANILIKSCQRRELPIAFGLLDIDDFKQVNDLHGHATGDRVLTSLSNYLKFFFRGDDIFCRYGGEEFAFGVVVDNKESVDGIANRLLAGIRKLNIQHGKDTPLKVSVSLGIYMCVPDKNTCFEQALKQADKAMYSVKNSGKDGYSILDN